MGIIIIITLRDRADKQMGENKPKSHPGAAPVCVCVCSFSLSDPLFLH